MFSLNAYIFGRWHHVGIDPHEECAVMFIDEIDNQFGDGTAYVFKFPDKEGHSPIADDAERHLRSQDMSGMMQALHDLEENNMDLDEQLKKLR